MRSTAFALALVAPLLWACGSDDVITPADDAAVALDGASPDAAAIPDASSPKDAAALPDADSGPPAQGVPPFGGSSGGSGGAAGVGGTSQQASSITYRLIVPASPAKPSVLLVVYSGTEGGQAMTSNLMSAGPSTGTDGFIRAVLDGVTYNGNGAAGATVLDDVRSRYDIDNDRTYLLGESAGTTAALKLGFHLRPSYFAAYWANDVNATDAPGQTAAQLGFAPWGQVGPGGDFTDATTLVNAMSAAGYRLPNPAPYAGAGAGTHGDLSQFLAALKFFPTKTRK